MAVKINADFEIAPTANINTFTTNSDNVYIGEEYTKTVEVDYGVSPTTNFKTKDTLTKYLYDLKNGSVSYATNLTDGDTQTRFGILYQKGASVTSATTPGANETTHPMFLSVTTESNSVTPLWFQFQDGNTDAGLINFTASSNTNRIISAEIVGISDIINHATNGQAAYDALFGTSEDADTIINKWDEVKKFLQNITEGEDLASILNNLVTLDTAQTISGVKSFSSPISGDLLGNSTTADRLKSTTIVGSGVNPIYFSGGIPVASGDSVGSADHPVYLSSGTIAQGYYIPKLNGNNLSSAANFYAPIYTGTTNQVLLSTGSSTKTPAWSTFTLTVTDSSTAEFNLTTIESNAKNALTSLNIFVANANNATAKTSEAITNGNVYLTSTKSTAMAPSSTFVSSIKLKGDNGISVIADANGDLTFLHSNNITEKADYTYEYDYTNDKSLSANGGSFTVPDFKYDAYGHLTAYATRTITLKLDLSSVNNATLSLYLGSSSSNQTIGTSFTANASTNISYYIPLATQVTSTSGTNTWGVVKGHYNGKNNTIGQWSECKIVDGIVYYYDRANDGDTKNTAGSTDSSDKLFLIGATSQDTNPETYSQDTAYVGTDGHLYSKSSQVVNLADNQTITGDKTFSGTLTANSTVTFNGSTRIDSLTAGNLLVEGSATLSGNVSLNTVIAGTWNGNVISVNYGGTGTTSLTEGEVLIGHGTSKVTTRGITNNRNVSLSLTPSDNLITANTLAYWNGNSYITNVGIITSGTWQGDTIDDDYLTQDYELLSNVTSKGSSTQPVYFDASGVATNCTYLLNKTVPSNAIFTDTTYNFSGVTFVSGSSSEGSHDCDAMVKNGHYYYTTNGPSTDLGASTNDGAVYVQSYSDAWVALIAQDYRNGRLFVRGKNNGTWKDWYIVAQKGDKISIFNNDSGYLTSSSSLSAANLTGTISSGVIWKGSTITSTYLPDDVVYTAAAQALTNKTYEGFTLNNACKYDIHDTNDDFKPSFKLDVDDTVITEKSLAHALNNRLFDVQSTNINKTLKASLWTDSGISVAALTSGQTYVLQIYDSDNSVTYSGIFSGGSTENDILDEIPLHASNLTDSKYRIYAGIWKNELLLSSQNNSDEGLSYNLTIKYKLLI